MKVRLSFKTPGVEDQLTEEEREYYDEVLQKFLRYNEYVTLEFDTETNTAIVIPK